MHLFGLADGLQRIVGLRPTSISDRAPLIAPPGMIAFKQTQGAFRRVGASPCASCVPVALPPGRIGVDGTEEPLEPVARPDGGGEFPHQLRRVAPDDHRPQDTVGARSGKHLYQTGGAGAPIFRTGTVPGSQIWTFGTSVTHECTNA